MINRHKRRTRNEICVRPSNKDTRNPLAAMPEGKHQITKGGDRDRSAPGRQAGSETDGWGRGVAEAFSRPRMQRCWGPARRVLGIEWTAAGVPTQPLSFFPAFLPGGLHSLIPCARSTAWPSTFPTDGPIPVTFSLLRIESLYWTDISMGNIWSEYIPPWKTIPEFSYWNLQGCLVASPFWGPIGQIYQRTQNPSSIFSFTVFFSSFSP